MSQIERSGRGIDATVTELEVPSAASLNRVGMAVVALLDRLTERLAFERSMTRLYEGLIAKLDKQGSFPDGPAREDLLAIQNEEVRHVGLLHAAIQTLGGDPRAMSAGARLARMTSSGVLQVIVNSRTTLAQGLSAMLMVERADSDGWRLLIELTRALGRHELADSFYLASAEEERHVEIVRRWVSHHALQELYAGLECQKAA
ncbi:ferritin-like domain-containing protein [Chondromyces crocatus]|uniref:Ferritin-like domain-containing protein n=1 Tax=Chondromyces crocatus TaxID=52 RepID=A0A0K1EPV0_CHOCO|nr:ferritin-like domain-containing protein [Chondromyces crocatus]AKT42955.1 uncharacterized protein CMC5_071830 [Chondromyces crocatus]